METCVLIPQALSIVLTSPREDAAKEGPPVITLWTNRPLTQGERLHPEEGSVRLDNLENRATLKSCDVRFKFGCYEEIIQVEGSDVRHCNWVRFTQSTTSQNDANVIATKRKDRIKYKVTRHVGTNEEIKVFFDVKGDSKRKSGKMSLLKSMRRKSGVDELVKKDESLVFPDENSENDISLLYMRPITAHPSKPRTPVSLSPPPTAERRILTPTLPSRSKSPRLLAGTGPLLGRTVLKKEEVLSEDIKATAMLPTQEQRGTDAVSGFLPPSDHASSNTLPIRPSPIRPTPLPQQEIQDSRIPEHQTRLPPPLSTHIPRSYHQLSSHWQHASFESSSPKVNISKGSFNTTKHDDSALSKGSLDPSMPSNTPGSSRVTSNTPGSSRITMDSDSFATPLKHSGAVKTSQTSTPKMTPSPSISTPGSLQFSGVMASSTPMKDQGYASKENSDGSPQGVSSPGESGCISTESEGQSPSNVRPVSKEEVPSFLSQFPDTASSSQGPVMRRREKTWLPCEVCGKKFDRPSLLKRHMRVHTGEKPHACDVCGKAFSTSSSLNTHRRIHSGEKPHECPVCGKCFTASSNLYYHRMTHKKEKPHKCELCSKSFPTPGDLKSHMYVHNGSWPHKCEVCNRGFSKQTNLKNHMLLHSGDKPHDCPVCGKKFALACNLKTHIKTHEEESCDSCVRCSRKFPLNHSYHSNGLCQDCSMVKDGATQKNEDISKKSPPAHSGFSISSIISKNEGSTPASAKMNSGAHNLMPNVFAGNMPPFFPMHPGANPMHYGLAPQSWPSQSLHHQYGM